MSTVSDALDNARQSVETLKSLEEPARGGRLIDSNIADIAGELDAALNAVAAAVDPNTADNSAVSKFLSDLSDALAAVREKHVQ